jgi:hypothetical protein
MGLKAAVSGRSAPSLCFPLPAPTTKNAHPSSYNATKHSMFTNFLLCLVILLGISSKWNLELFILPGCVLELLRRTHVAFDTAKGHVHKDSLLNNSGVLGALHSTSDVINDPCPMLLQFCNKKQHDRWVRMLGSCGSDPMIESRLCCCILL